MPNFTKVVKFRQIRVHSPSISSQEPDSALGLIHGLASIHCRNAIDLKQENILILHSSLLRHFNVDFFAKRRSLKFHLITRKTGIIPINNSIHEVINSVELGTINVTLKVYLPRWNLANMCFFLYLFNSLKWSVTDIYFIIKYLTSTNLLDLFLTLFTLN